MGTVQRCDRSVHIFRQVKLYHIPALNPQRGKADQSLSIGSLVPVISSASAEHCRYHILIVLFAHPVAHQFKNISADLLIEIRQQNISVPVRQKAAEIIFLPGKIVQIIKGAVVIASYDDTAHLAVLCDRGIIIGTLIPINQRRLTPLGNAAVTVHAIPEKTFL